MPPNICLITAGQLSSNPRIVKEADALAEAGFQVDVVATAFREWVEKDRELTATRAWRCHVVGGHEGNRRLTYWATRARHGASRRSLPALGHLPQIDRWAAGRATPELARAARKLNADLYIAHNLAALPAAVTAASRHGVPVGYDAEDFLPGMRPEGGPPSPTDLLTERLERRYIPRCSYITAASAGIADAYAKTYSVPLPTTILNVFPLAQRPIALRDSRQDGSLTLYWFSQVIGPSRGLEDAVGAMGLLGDLPIALHLQGYWLPGYREELLAHAESLGVRQERIIHHPLAPPDDLIRSAANYDIGLAVERADTVNHDICVSNKLFTYLLAGNALVATATKGQQAIVDAIPDAAFLYAPGDIHSLAAKLREWHANRDCLQRARRAAWQAGERRYNWDVEKQSFLQVVDRTLDDRKRRVN